MNVTITVTDPDLISAIKSWEDGSEYQFTVTQDAPMKFTATNAEEVPEEPAASEEAEPEYAAKKSPGIALLIAKPAK